MAYSDIKDPSAYFQTVLWTGNNSHPRTITNDGNSDLQPDWIWVKQRTTSTNNFLYDSSRTFNANGELASNADGAEGSFDNNLYGYISAATSDGFTVSSGTTNGDDFNQSSREYVAWQWKVNGGTTSSDTNGSITSTVQADTTAGFSIVSFTGNGTDGATVGHGLGVVPAMVIFKCRDTANTDWRVYHQSISPTNAVSLNSNGAEYGASGVFGGTFTSTLLKVENDTGANRNTSPMIAYCFAEKQGYSKFGTYTGNGASDASPNTNGPFIYTGFSPAFVIIKKTSAVDDWLIFDNKRAGYDPAVYRLFPSSTSAETSGTNNTIQFTSNGFKIRFHGGSMNTSSGTYIYMAFAETPFVADGIPTTAR
jgi:hypothetical protein